MSIGSSSHHRQPVRAALIATAMFCGLNLVAQARDPEPVAVVEIGPAVSRSITDSESSIGATIAVEATAVEKWLELEAGVTRLYGRYSGEWSTDVIFKKPWTLSRSVEFMMGVGPEWTRTSVSGISTDAVAIEVAPDFMFWPRGKHRFGWYLEPSYEYKFGSHPEHSLAVAGGLLIAIPKKR